MCSTQEPLFECWLGASHGIFARTWWCWHYSHSADEETDSLIVTHWSSKWWNQDLDSHLTKSTGLSQSRAMAASTLPLCVIKTPLWSLTSFGQNSFMLLSIHGEVSKCFGIVFKDSHNWAVLYLSSSFASDFPPVTTFAGHTQLCHVGKYTWAHKLSMFSFPLCKLTLSSCPSSHLPPVNLYPSLPPASTQLEGVSCLL